MSIHDRLAALAGELHLTGFGSEMTEAVSRVSTFFADEVHSIAQHVEGLAPAGVEDVAATLRPMIEAEFAKLQPAIDALTAELKAEVGKRTLELGADVDQRIEAKFAELLAKASQADAAKADTPPEPAAQQ